MGNLSFFFFSAMLVRQVGALGRSVHSRGILSQPLLQQARFYKSRLTQESLFEGKNLAQTSPLTETTGDYVVEDNTPPPFKPKEGVNVVGFKYPNAKAPDNKVFYAIAPRKPPMVLTGIAGSYVENLYKVAMNTGTLMKTESELKKYVAPLTSD